MRKLLVLCALGVLGAGLLATTGSAGTQTRSVPCAVQAPHEGTSHFGGIISASAIAGSCAVHNTSDAANGTPPLLYNGGPVMPSSAGNPITVTPIFWNPPGTGPAMDGRYKDLIKKYLGDVAHDSGLNTNVFSVATEYFGTNGTIGNYVKLGAPIDDHQRFTSDCIVAPADASGIYSDGSGYTACLSDAAVTGEIQRLIDASHGRLAQNDYTHIYVLYTPKHVESCFNPGDTTSTAGGQACTINYEPTAAYCAYHSMMGNNWPAFGTIYANMPYPVLHSPVGFTCGSDAGGHTLQAPNHDVDADQVLSPTSHEINEAITDPNVFNGWYDSSGFENGDECAYVYGAMSGKPGQEYNQVINKNQYLTQEEFSNLDFADTGGGCVQSKNAEG